MNKELMGVMFVMVLLVGFIALVAPYVYLMAARSWYWGGWPAMLLLAVGLYCYLVLAWVRR